MASPPSQRQSHHENPGYEGKGLRCQPSRTLDFIRPRHRRRCDGVNGHRRGHRIGAGHTRRVRNRACGKMLRSGRIICDRARKVDGPSKSVRRRNRERGRVARSCASCKRYGIRCCYGKHAQHRHRDDRAAGGIDRISAITHIHGDGAGTPVVTPKIKAARTIHQGAASAVGPARSFSI